MTGHFIEGSFNAGSPLLTKIKDSFKNKGLPVLFFGGISLFIYGLAEVTMRVVNESDRLHRVYDIKSDLEIILNGLIEKAQKEERYKDLTVYLDLKYKFFPNLYSMSPKKMIEALDNAIEVYKEDKNLVGVLEKFRDLLQKAAGSSPLTQKEAKKGFNKSFGNLDRNYGDNSSADRLVKTYWKQMYPQYLPYVNYIVDDKQDLMVMEAKINELEQSILRIDKELGSVKFVADLNGFLDSFKVWRDTAEQELSLQKMEVSSSLTQDLPQVADSPLMPGGIDFTQINYLTRPMGSFQGLDLRLPLLSRAEIEGIDIKLELAAMEQMINAKIEVSTDRLKRLLAAMSQKDAFTSQRETQLLPLLLRLCWLKEERGVETTPDFRAVLLIADTGLFVEQGNTRYSLN